MKTFELLVLAGATSIASAAAIDERALESLNLHVVRQDQVDHVTNTCADVPKDEPCTILDVSSEFTFYGGTEPRDMADRLWDECKKIGCDIMQFQVDTSDIGGMTTIGKKVNIMPHGSWMEEQRHALIFAMTELVGKTQVKYTKEEDRPPVQGVDVNTMEVWKAPSYFHVRRHVWTNDERWDEDGELSMAVEMEGDEGNTCEILIDAINEILPYLWETGSTVLGHAKAACAMFDE